MENFSLMIPVEASSHLVRGTLIYLPLERAMLRLKRNGKSYIQRDTSQIRGAEVVHFGQCLQQLTGLW